MSALVEPNTASRPSNEMRWIGLRLGLLIVVLLALNAAVPIGLLANFRQLRQAGPASLFFRLLTFGMGWIGFAPMLLALWLAWGGGTLIMRIAMVLGVTAVGVGLVICVEFPVTGFHDSINDPFQLFIGILLLHLLVILSVNAVVMPLRGYLGWQFSFTAEREVANARPGAKWSLFHIMVFTAFAAFALAFVRLVEMWVTNFNGEMPGWTWLYLVLAMVLSLASAGAAAFAVFFVQVPWRWRLAALPLTIITVYSCLFGYFTFVPIWAFFWPTVFGCLGTVAAAFVNLALIRLAGVRLWRQADQIAAESAIRASTAAECSAAN